jgi:hypothetical protein
MLRWGCRGALAGVAVALCLWSWGGSAPASDVEVPVRLQAELLAKVAAYDRSFAERARGRALVLVVVKPGAAESERVGEQILAELAVLPEIGNLPHREEKVLYQSPRALADLVKARGAAIIYMSTNLADQVAPIAAALDGVSVLSVGVVAAYVQSRAVLGFDAQSGKPKLVVHLDQARRQRVDFRAGLLQLARVMQ